MELKKNEFERSLTKQSSSLLVTLPSQFVKKHELEKGAKVIVKINNDWSLTIIPKAITKTDEKKITIEAYREVAREIVEKILSGAEKITIISDKKITDEIRKEIRFFVDGMPQAEIFEDEPQRIAVYKIASKTIPNRKVLHRLLNLVSNLFQNIKEQKSLELGQNIKDLKKFYIMLNGNIRTFHNSGFLEYNDEQLTQKKASDYRIFSYQLKIIGYILRDFEIDESILDFFINIESYFNKIFDAFLKQDEKLAHKLWFQNQSLEQEGKKLMESMSSNHKYKIIFLLMIVKICRSMTALLYS